MMKVIRALIVLAVVPLASSCLLLSGRCVYELRNVMAYNSILLNGTDSLTASVLETEQRDSDPDKDMSWQIRGTPLKGHVLKIVLLASATSTTPSYEFPLAAENMPALSNGFVRQSEGANLNGFFDLLKTGTAVIRITTDIPGRTQIDLVLQNVQKTDWNRPYCS